MEKLIEPAQPALEHALTLVLLSYLIERNSHRGRDSIVVNTVVVVKRMGTKRAQVVSHTNCRDLSPSVASCGPWDVFSVTATAQICKVSCDEES
jgi:hypothetical protein